MQLTNSEQIQNFLNEINENNSTNYKLEVLKKYKDSELIKRILKLTHDRVQYNFGIGRTTLAKYIPSSTGSLDIIEILDFLEYKLATRELTGNAAINGLFDLFNQSNADDIFIIQKILERDLRINIGRTQINKVHKDLIVKPCYLRCDVLTKKTAKNISYPAILEKKADGTYREFAVDAELVNSRSRSGESYEYPLLSKYLSKLPSNTYAGELTVKATERTIKIVQEKLDYAKRKGDDTEELENIIALYNKYKELNKEYILPRGIGNGIINSLEFPEEDLILELWDCISFEDYNTARKKDKKNPCKTTYAERWENLKEALKTIDYPNIRLIEHKIVNNPHDVMLQNKIWMEAGFEGSILKDWKGVFADSTSKHQLKIKLKISAEMRIIGFADGTPGTKREGKVGSLIFKNDEGTVKGRCSGFTDEQLEEFTNNKEYYLNKIIEVEFNDLSRAAGSEEYALSHPRFIEVRDDKDSTDTLEQIFKMREMAMDVSSYFEN